MTQKMKSACLGTAILFSATAGLSSAKAHAAARDSFNYPVGISIAGQSGGTGWAGAWQGGSGAIVAGLSYPGLTASGAALGPSSAYTARTLATAIPGSTGTYVLIRALMSSPAAGTPSSFGMLGLSTPTNLNVALGDYPGSNPEAANWALQFNGQRFFSQKPVTADTTYLVARIDFQDGNDRVRLWINPPTFVDSPLVPPDLDATNGDIASITGVWWQGNTGDGMVLDELAIDDAHPCLSMSGRAAWYAFDETTGTLANDLAGGNRGTVVNGATHLVSGKSGAALVFDGVNDYVQAPASSLLDVGTGDFAFEGWLRPNTLGPTQVILDKRTGSGSTLRGYSFFIYGTQLGVQLADASGYANYLSSSVSLLGNGAWHHVAVSVQRNSATGVRFYLDGAALPSTGNPLGRIGSLNTTSPLRLGTRTTDTALTGWFGGAMDEIALYRRALTAADVAAIVAADSVGACRCGNPILDSRDGQSYDTTSIGGVCWTARNMNLGTFVPTIPYETTQTDNGIFEKACYDNTPSNCDVYGGLYRWSEAMQYSPSDSGIPGHTQGICPMGWHVPTQAEWMALISVMANNHSALKEAGTAHWLSPNVGGNDAVGFHAVGGGKWMYREFYGLQSIAEYWCSTESNEWNGTMFGLVYNSVWGMGGMESKTTYNSIRCVRN